MSTAKMLWLIWCLIWATVWMTFGWVMLGLNLIPFGISLLLTIPCFMGNDRPGVQRLPARPHYGGSWPAPPARPALPPPAAYQPDGLYGPRDAEWQPEFRRNNPDVEL